MGCTGSSEKKKEEPPKKDPAAFTDLKTANNERADTSPSRPANSHTAATATAVPQDDVKDTTAARPKSKYKCGGPGRQGELFECFKGGLLYRITNADTWYFYNDTTEYEMHINWKFGPSSTLEALGDTKLVQDETKWWVATLVVYPGETRDFVRGSYNGYKSSLSVQPLSDAYKKKMIADSTQAVEKEIATVKAVAGGIPENDLERVLEACLVQNVPFVDLSFKPLSGSLSRPVLDDRDLNGIGWMRPSSYLPAEQRTFITTFNQDIRPDDVDQGQLGDCWFLCAVASLAEKPEKIKDIFRHPVSVEVAKRERALGAYRVTLNKNGWWEVIILDDYLPCVGNAPVFAKCSEDPCELWPSLLEKAYAKLHGSYASITGGDALLALQDLTGYPVTRFDTEWSAATTDAVQAASLFSQVLKYDQEGYLINLNTPGVDNSAYMGVHHAKNSKDFEEEYTRIGLGMGHAYSVMRVVESGPHRLMQIRNPWGNDKEWNGAWGDHDAKWQEFPDVAKQCGFTGPKADGSFWMHYDDILKYFDGGGACFMHENWFDYRVRGSFTAGFPSIALKVTVKKRTKVLFTISQRDRRGATDPADAKYMALMLSYCPPHPEQPGKQKVELNSTTDADRPSPKFTFNYSRDLSMKLDLETKSEPYLIVPRIYEAGANKKYVLGMISQVGVGADLSVEFIALPQSCRIFGNFQSFDLADAAAAESDWQFNPEVGCPITRRGSEFRNA